MMWGGVFFNSRVKHGGQGRAGSIELRVCLRLRVLKSEGVAIRDTRENGDPFPHEYGLIHSIASKG
jgi:hypothetical protein